jgi:hypothetical protein
MGVYAIANLGVDPVTGGQDEFLYALSMAGITVGYHDGFANGFYGTPCDWRGRHRKEDYELGHADGTAAYAAAKEAVRG